MTGADGFVGRHLVQALIADGAAVRALDVRFGRAFPDRVETIAGDILDEERIRAVMAGIDTVFHLAAVTDLWAPPKDPGQHYRINAGGTQTVLDAATEAGVRRFVYCSSNVALIGSGAAPEEIDESFRPSRDALFGAYARSKRDAEEIVAAAGDRIETIVAMPGTPIGPGDHRPTPPGRLLRDLANGLVPALPRRALVNLVDVEHLAGALARTRYRGVPGSKYLLTGCDVSFGRLAETMAEITGLSMPREIVPRSVALAAAVGEDLVWSTLTGRAPTASFDGVRMAVRMRRFSNAKARRDLDLAPTDLHQSVARAVDWMAQRGMIERALPGIEAPTGVRG
ncbi:MAG: NAD-dependent epimerase/dehydratase family protein [Pseudomonadota bacterium]